MIDHHHPSCSKLLPVRMEDIPIGREQEEGGGDVRGDTIIDVLNWKEWKLQSSLDSTITTCERQKQKIKNILLFIVLDYNYK